MAGVFQPAPTYADVVLIDETTGKPRFNTIWLDWFLNLVAILDALGGTTAGTHNALSSIQGGGASERYHLTNAQNALVAALANPIAIATGGTGATTAANARTNLGLGTVAVQNVGTIAFTGGTIDGVAITTGSVNNTPIGGTTRAAVSGTTLSATTGLQPGTDAGAAQTASTIRAGTGAPDNANGNNGDYYFRSDGTAGSYIYHRAAGAWTAII